MGRHICAGQSRGNRLLLSWLWSCWELGKSRQKGRFNLIMSGPLHSFRCAKLAIARNFGARHWTARFMCRSGGSQCYWRTDQAFGPRLPVPNVAFWCCLSLNGQETRSKLQPSSFQNLGLATAKHHATEGGAVPSANGCLCLTLLSERTRN